MTFLEFIISCTIYLILELVIISKFYLSVKYDQVLDIHKHIIRVLMELTNMFRDSISKNML